MTENKIIELAPDGLTRLLAESLPTHAALSPQSARVALMMHRAGRDAGAIAERIKAPLGSVLIFLDSLKRQEEVLRRLEATRRAAAAARSAAGEPIALEPAVAADEEPLEEPPTDTEPAAPPSTRCPEVIQPHREIPREFELSDLQQAVIRRLRKAHVSAATISRMTRISVDQVMRVAGEIP